MYRKLWISMLIGSMLLTGCGIDEQQTIEVMSTALDKELIQVAVYLDETLAAGQYEPEVGVYVGADVEHNNTLEGDIQAYEALVDKEQAFRVFQYSGSGDFTSKELLECIANKQVPYIKVMANDSYDLMPIYQMIGDLNSRYQSTVFVELFPVQGEGIDPIRYKDYYEEAYRLIKKYIDDTVIVWSVNWEQVYDAPLYYPGNHMVDWVGLNTIVPKYQEDTPYTPAIQERMDFWYQTYQNEKPMLLSTLAVSHFSRVDHTYTIEDAKNKLTYFYTDMIREYPRIKGILYSDVAMYEVSQQGKEDYRITSQDKLVEHMGMLQSDQLFLSELQEVEEAMYEQPIRYPIDAYAIEGTFYVQHAQVQHLDFEKQLFRQVPCLVDIDGEKYYLLEALVQKEKGFIEKIGD